MKDTAKRRDIGSELSHQYPRFQTSVFVDITKKGCFHPGIKWGENVTSPGG